jgi:hypothetical protein
MPLSSLKILVMQTMQFMDVMVMILMGVDFGLRLHMVVVDFHHQLIGTAAATVRAVHLQDALTTACL